MNTADSNPGTRARALREQKGLTRQQIADQTGLSEKTIQNFEAGHHFRMDTAHKIATALGVETVWFQPKAGGPAPASESELLRAQTLREFRIALLTPDWAAAPSARPFLALKADAVRMSRAYEAKNLTAMARIGACLLLEIHELDITAGQASTVATIYELVGRYLTLAHASDLALISFNRGLRIAQDYGLSAAVGSNLDGLLWAYLRLGELRTVEDTAVRLADQLEPKSLRSVEPGRVAAWGWVLRQASAAAVRNNRYEEAKAYNRALRAASSALEQILVTDTIPFGQHTARSQETEAFLLAGQPDKALEAANRPLDGTHAHKKRHRHQLDIAMCHAELGQTDEARSLLAQLEQEASVWLTNQPMARRVVERLARNFRRQLPKDLVRWYSILSRDEGEGHPA